MIKCPHCNTDNLDDALFCKECGIKIETKQEQATTQTSSIKCEKCGTENPVGTVFCKNCGCKIEEEIINNNNKDKAIIKFSVNKWLLLLIGAIILICVLVILIPLKNNNADKENNENINSELQEDLEAEKVEEHVHEYVLKSISPTMHRKTCKSAGCDYYIEEECTFIDGVCACGNKSIEETENKEENDDKQDLLSKISGVWRYRDNYFMNFDGGDGFSHGWFESEMLPYTHITSCKKTDENIYEVEFLQDAVDGDEDYDGIESYAWNATIDGSYDGFRTAFKMIDDNGEESYYIYLANNSDEALDYYYSIRDFDKYCQEYSEKLAKIYESLGIVIDDETICDLARKYYKKHNGEAPPLVSIDSRDGNELTIHLYEIMEYEDTPEENHWATWGWYWIDSTTLTGTDMFDMPVDLNEVR